MPLLIRVTKKIADITEMAFFHFQKPSKVSIQVDGKVVRIFEPDDLKKVKDGFGFKRLWKSGELHCGANLIKVTILGKHVTCR